MTENRVQRVRSVADNSWLVLCKKAPYFSGLINTLILNASVFQFSNFRLVVDWVDFLLGISPASEY
jgi:hypothetical protein